MGGGGEGDGAKMYGFARYRWHYEERSGCLEAPQSLNALGSPQQGIHRHAVSSRQAIGSRESEISHTRDDISSGLWLGVATTTCRP